MKKFISILICVFLFSACQKSKQMMVEDLIEAKNCFEKEKVNQFLSDNFMLYGTDTLNKEEYLATIDTLKAFECQSSILQIHDLDSIVKTEERVRSIVDSLLEVTPAIIQKKTYKFADNKLVSITVDSTMNYEDYTKSLNEKYTSFAFYVKDQYDIDDENEITVNIKKYLSEFAGLPASDRKQYKTYAHLQGTYVSRDCALYRKLIFRGKRTVTIVDAIFGFSFTSGYELDENIIRIRTDKSDLLFEIKDSKTLIGDGFAKGTFRKSD